MACKPDGADGVADGAGHENDDASLPNIVRALSTSLRDADEAEYRALK
jgi:hypothetical protein